MEEKQNEEEILDFTKPTFEYIPKGNHGWRQYGYYIICKSCELEHATWIGENQLLTGIKEDGQPILKSR